MSSPSITEYLIASQAAYSEGNPLSAGLSPLTQNGNEVASVSALDGFSAQAFTDASGNIIIAYEGTTPQNPASYGADAKILSKQAPAAYTDAETFAAQVQAVVNQLYGGQPKPQIFVTGHSLGGAEAEYVVSQSEAGGVTIAGGATFGAPGLIGYVNSGPQPNLVDYVNYGDPVANYASDVTEETGFAPSSGMDHVGTVIPLGSSLDGDNLALVSSAFGATKAAVDALPFIVDTGWSAEASLAALGLFGNIDNHLLASYASNLQITLPTAGSDRILPSPIAVLASLDAPLGAAGQQDFTQATLSTESQTAQSPNFSVQYSQGDSTLTITQNKIIQDDISGAGNSADLSESDPGTLTVYVDQLDSSTQDATFTDGLTSSQENFFFSESGGVEEGVTTNYANGTSGVAKFDYTSTSDAFETTSFYSSRDGAGQLIGSTVTKDDGTSQSDAVYADGSSAEVDFDDLEGTGTITQEAIINPDNSSIMITYGSEGSPSELYSGPDLSSSPDGISSSFAQTISPYTTSGSLIQQADNIWTLNIGTLTVNQVLENNLATIIYASTDIPASFYDNGDDFVDQYALDSFTIDSGGHGFSGVSHLSGYVDVFNLDDPTPGEHVIILTFQSTIEDYTTGLSILLPEQILTVTEDVVACYLFGTRIATAAGAVPVEELAIGELVRTHGASLMPIQWIGHRYVDCRRHPDPRKVWPVRVRAGAFGEGMPCRDLWLSPDHAVFVDDVLIPIQYLINGSTIAQEPRDEVTYYHVELARHDVLLAEGLPCETYLDTGNRSNFADESAPLALHPDFSALTWEALGCAPLIVTGPVFEAVRQRLAARSGLVSAQHAA